MNFYLEASNIVKLVKIKRGSVKNLVFSSDQQNKKGLYALVCESLKYHDLLSEVLERTALLKHERSLKNNAYLGVVLLYEHLLGKGLTGKCQEMIKRHKSSIHSQCELMKVQARVTSFKELLGNSTQDPGLRLPKYVRINTIKTGTDTVVRTFLKEGWLHVLCTKESFKEVASTLDKASFTTDPYIPDLLVFPPTTDFHDNKLYTTGEIILQDKASCFPAYLLSPAPGSLVIDCCAAPGNKTSHLAAIMENKGCYRNDPKFSDRTIFAFDKAPQRLTTLESMMVKAGATCVKAKCQDFLGISPLDSKYQNVEYILVDPSCSGTGMVNRRKEQTNEDEISKERLEQLSKFQITILKHAFKFPNVKRIVYSTCSIQDEENEQVVEKVMSSVNQNFKMRLLLPDWPERGVKGYEHAQCCLRMSHDSALTNGFFVACFERRGDIDTYKNGTQIHLTKEEIIENSVLEVKHKHMKRKKLKHEWEHDSGMKTSQINENIDMTAFNSNSRKRKHQQQNNNMSGDAGEILDDDVEHGHRNTCKKKRKKSKQRDIVEDNSSNKKSDNDTEYRHTNSCKKKRKKSKHRDIVEEEIDIRKNYENRHSNNCKKKRKRSKQRDTFEDTHNSGKLTSDSEHKHSRSCKKKRKKSKQKDHISKTDTERAERDCDHKHSSRSCKKKKGSQTKEML